MAIKTKDLLLFYVFFEFSIIPITLIVFIHGYQPEKLQASIHLLLYTVVRRLPLLVYVFITERAIIIISSLAAIPVTFCFMVKTPLYLLHTWLPKAHVEAPVGGSMVLAGVLLKLGSYGLLLFIPLLKMNTLITFYMTMCFIGSIISSLICIRQSDMKILIAYSSVVHMRVVNLGFISGLEIGYTCALIMCISHGLRSPFLFAQSYWIYLGSHSRLLINAASICPLTMASLIWLTTMNIGVPPRLGLWSEIFMVTRTIKFMNTSIPLLLFMFFLGAIYNLYLYTSCAHTKYSPTLKGQVRLIPIVQVVFLRYGSFICLDLFLV